VARHDATTKETHS
jgi:hypothetical protein